MASIVGGPSGASVPGHARTGLECGRILATIWIPGANPFQRCARRAREKSLATELGFEGTREVGRRSLRRTHGTRAIDGQGRRTVAGEDRPPLVRPGGRTRRFPREEAV